MPNAYALIIKPAAVDVGQELPASDERLECAVSDPRRLPFIEATEGHGDNVTALLLADRLALAELEPLGPTAWAGSDDIFLTCEAGWKVTALHPVERMFGPQGEHVTAAIRLAEQKLTATAEGVVSPEMNRYDETFDNQDYAELAHSFDVLDAVLAPVADSFAWREGFSPRYFTTLSALAARDLLDTDAGKEAGWTQERYDMLTAPWRAAFGRGPHPDDQ